MGWAVEQNTGVADHVIRLVWFNGHIYAGTEDDGVWRRDGVGPWVQVFAGGGVLWYWEDDDALYCGGGPGAGNQIHRSTDGVAWPMDVDLNVAFGLQGFYHNWSEIGGYGDYLYLANHDVGAGTTFFYRRDLGGTWAAFGAPHVGTEGANGRGVIGFGGEVYWTSATRARYWDGAAWSLEPTLHGNIGGAGYMSIIDNQLYIGSSSTYDLDRRYYWRTATATSWSELNLTVPSAAWRTWTLSEGADGEVYTAVNDGLDIRIYRKTNNHMALVSADTPAAGAGLWGGVCVDAADDMYFGTRALGTVRFFAFVPDHNQTPAGNGLPNQAMDCDADGDALYLALYDNAGNPILVRVPLPLTATAIGSLMLNPGAGDAINVKCSEVGQQLAVSGFFGANEQVEVSQDAGLTWTDVDPGTWANERAQPLEVGPEALDDLMVCLDNLQDLYDTEDMGGAWTQEQAAIGYSPGAMRRQRNEVLLGDDAANRIDYSPNRGQQLTNVTGAFAGNVAALDAA